MSDRRPDDEMRLSDVSGRLQPGRLLGVTLGMISAHRRAALGVWVLFAAVNLVGTVARPGGTAPFTPMGLLESALIAAISLGLVRALGDVTPAWRLASRGLIFIGMDFASSLGLGLWYAAGDLVDRLTGTGVAGALLGLALLTADGIATWLVFVGLALWTYGHAYDAPPMSIADSWRGARGAAGAVIGVTAILAILPTEGVLWLMDWAGLGALGGVGWWTYAIIEAGLLAWFSVAVVSVPAALYRLRRGRGGGAVAEVFD